jgi:hypothetical protein
VSKVMSPGKDSPAIHPVSPLPRPTPLSMIQLSPSPSFLPPPAPESPAPVPFPAQGLEETSVRADEDSATAEAHVAQPSAAHDDDAANQVHLYDLDVGDGMSGVVKPHQIVC